jgi:hypothetical protein
MKSRDNMSAVIEGLQSDHGLLAAYLEATNRIDWQALHKRVMIGEPPKPSDIEAHLASSTALQLPEVAPSTTSTFVLGRANLAEFSERRRLAAIRRKAEVGRQDLQLPCTRRNRKL